MRMDAPFPEYRPPASTAYRSSRNTQNVALGIIVGSLALMMAQSSVPGPGLWLIFGATLGIFLILRGLEGIFFFNHYCTSWGRHLNQRRDVWCPWILYAAQTLLLFLGVALFWTTSTLYVFPASTLLHANAIALVLAIPAYRLAAAFARFTESNHWLSVAEMLRFSVWTLAAVLLGGLTTVTLFPPGQAIPQGAYAVLVFIWLGVLVVPIVCALLWANHLLSRQRKARQAGIK